jgi:hypothetical protein
MMNFLHHFSRDVCGQMLGKACRALVSEGYLALLEFIPDGSRVWPPAAVDFNLLMLATTASGDAYTFEDYQEMLDDAGFVDARKR